MRPHEKPREIVLEIRSSALLLRPLLAPVVLRMFAPSIARELGFALFIITAHPVAAQELMTDDCLHSNDGICSDRGPGDIAAAGWASLSSSVSCDCGTDYTDCGQIRLLVPHPDGLGNICANAEPPSAPATPPQPPLAPSPQSPPAEPPVFQVNPTCATTINELACSQCEFSRQPSRFLPTLLRKAKAHLVCRVHRCDRVYSRQEARL